MRRERVRLEREPITDANIDAATSGPDISERSTRSSSSRRSRWSRSASVPRERVRLDKDTVTGQERVAEELRKEQIEVHDEDGKVGRHERRRRR